MSIDASEPENPRAEQGVNSSNCPRTLVVPMPGGLFWDPEVFRGF